MTTTSTAREVWRRIHNFPDYEVNSRGHVRIAGSGKKITPANGLAGNSVKLWYKGDPKTFRTSELVKKYFPEMREDGSADSVEWRKLENFPEYEATVFGSFRNRATKYELPILAMTGYDAKVTLWKNGVRGTYDTVRLIEETFPESVNEADLG